jgi:hypothetical protein
VQGPCSDQSEQPDDQQNGTSQLVRAAVGNSAGASQTRREVPQPKMVAHTSDDAGRARLPIWQGREEHVVLGQRPDSERETEHVAGARDAESSVWTIVAMGSHREHRHGQACECDTRFRIKPGYRLPPQASPRASVRLEGTLPDQGLAIGYHHGHR